MKLPADPELRRVITETEISAAVLPWWDWKQMVSNRFCVSGPVVPVELNITSV